MRDPPRVGSIEIAEDMKFQRASWRVQRAGWIAMLAVAVAAMLGLFGQGPLARGNAGDAREGFFVGFERFTRLNVPQSLDIEIGAAARATDSTAAVWIDRDWLDAHEVSSILPEPESASLLPDRVLYAFTAPASGGSLKIRFRLEARGFGWMQGRAGVPGGPSYSFKQLVYP